MEQSSRLSRPQLKGAHALVVDDDADARDLITTVLTIRGAAVTPVESFEAAMEILKETTPDVLVADIGMPRYNGYALIAKIRSLPQTSRIPAVAVTAFTTPTDRDIALATGFQAHVSKPFDPDDLVFVIAELLYGRGFRG